MSVFDIFQRKLSRVIFLMCDALEEFDNYPASFVDMRTYGNKNQGMCYGCAATALIFKITSGVATPEYLSRSSDTGGFNQNLLKDFNISITDLDTFEGAIDCLRSGMYTPILEFFDLRFEDYADFPLDVPILKNENWREGLAAYRSLATILDEAGL